MTRLAPASAIEELRHRIKALRAEAESARKSAASYRETACERDEQAWRAGTVADQFEAILKEAEGA